jgi:predicted ATPase
MKDPLAGPHFSDESRSGPEPLSPGMRLGPYEILSPLGAGGMGRVYRARDSRLGRELAIKVLSGHLRASQEHLERFKQEARSASALNHPNIVTIYEIGLVGSTHFIAMELVAGKVLTELLNSRPMPIQQAIQVAAQVADGLAKAHEAGIVHRDLKPQNLMVTHDGFVKILDFGLAKPAVQPGELSEMSTIAGPETRPGTILGTVGYMSPEQASGQQLDFRSDQFSFGVVLYQMLTRKRAFQGRTEAETLAALLRDQPESIASLNPEAPAPLCWVVERCLAKEPGQRYSSTRDLARDLAEIRDRLSQAPAGSLDERPSDLPVPRTPIVGREKEVTAAKELLLREDVRLVTITGPGGIGKTRLTLEVAKQVSAQFPGGIHFVPLSAFSDPGPIPSAIARTVGVRETEGHTPLEALAEFFRNSLRGRLLLLLDNFEHLNQAAPLVAELLSLGPSLKLLVTSRAPLHVYGEYEFPVPPLELPDPKSLLRLEDLSKYSAVALFLQRAAAIKPDFKLTPDNAAAVAEICARLDGLPLAIELAAARVKMFPPVAMRARLMSRLHLLTGGPRDVPARQQTLRAAIDWSYDLLDAAEQKLFRRLAVFAGGCTLEAVEAVCNTKSDLGLDLLEGLASMMDKNLLKQVEQGEGESRFVMLETIREYGTEKLAASGEEALTRRAHAAYFLVLAEEAASEDAGGERTEVLGRLEVEHDNFRAALEWLIESGNAEWGLRLGAALFRYWETREYLTEGREQLAKILKLPAAATHSKARGRVLFAAGVLAAVQGDDAASSELHRECLEIARHFEDQQGVAVSLNAIAVGARDRGDLAGARKLFTESLELWKELGNPIAVARGLSNLGSVAKMQGDFATARSLYDQCLAIFRELNDRTGVAWSLNYQGDVARDQGDARGARSLYEQSLAMFRELGDRWGIAGSLADLGNLAREHNDFKTAEALYAESLLTFKELGHKRGVARLMECFASAAADQSLADRALRLAGAAAALRQTLGAPLTTAEQVRLDAALGSARHVLTQSASTEAWLEGWALSLDKAVETALETDPSSSHAGTQSPSE